MGRIQWIDYARGLAIFGVVMWHVVGGVVGDGIPTSTGMVDFGNLWDLYTFRLMPIFFFISGIFFVRSLSRPFMQVLMNKLRTIAYPYALWTIITLLIGTVMARIGVDAETLSQLPRLFYDPISHFWFLYALFVMMIVSYAAYAAKINRWVILGFTLILFILSAATVFYNVWYVMGQIGYFFVYFIAGMLVGTDFIKRIDETPVTIHAALFAIGAVILYFIPIGLNSQALIWQPLAASIAMLMTINLSVMLARFEYLDFIRYWGVLSLEIYLVHVLASKAFRIVVYKFLHVENAWFHIITGILVGLYVPIVIKWVSDKLISRVLETNPLFVAPELKKTKLEAEPVPLAGAD